MDINKLSNRIIGDAIEVHKTLGPGLLESAYEQCLCHELNLRDLSFERQKDLPKHVYFCFPAPQRKAKEKNQTLRSWRLCGE